MRLSRAPLVPISLLRQRDCFIAGDTRFRAAARLQQSLWREAQGLSPGLHRPGGRHDVPTITLGSMLCSEDAARGANFLSSAVHAFVRRTLALREVGAGLQPDRLLRNLLSSEPLCFNLLAPLALDRDLATAVFRRLLPGFVHHVTSIRFETAPSRDRADPRFLSDGTAFDAAIEIITVDGECAMIFVETKFSEGCSGPAATPRPRYDEAARELALHRDPDAKALRSVAQEQFFRLSLLAGLMVRRGLTSRAHLLVIHPGLNRRVAVAAKLYAEELLDPAGTAPASIGFSALTLETFVDALREVGATPQATYLHQRYLNLGPVLDCVLQHPDPALDEPSGPREPPPAGPVLALPPPAVPQEAAIASAAIVPAAIPSGPDPVAPATPRTPPPRGPRRYRQAEAGPRASAGSSRPPTRATRRRGTSTASSPAAPKRHRA